MVDFLIRVLDRPWKGAVFGLIVGLIVVVMVSACTHTTKTKCTDYIFWQVCSEERE